MRVYLYRGLFGGVFSTGMDDLAGKLNADGHVATVHSWTERQVIEQQAIARGAADGAVGIVGHSLGGNSASYMAHDLLAAGIPVAYVGTVDATAPKPAPSPPTVSDNFQSSDPRGQDIAGATEFPMPHLNHIEIDKDSSVHERVRGQLRALSGAMPPIVGPLPDVPAPSPGAGDALETAINALAGQGGGDLAALAPLLKELLSQAGAAGQGASDIAALAPLLKELLDQTGAGGGDAAALRAAMAAVGAVAKDDSLTPVNAALGEGIGKMLNGRKTAFGIIGLLGTTVLPILFPQLAPFQALFRGIGAADVVANTPDLGQSLLVPIFSALTSWGVLGKIEKWVKGKKNR